jgi:hypothetical protein
MKYFNASFKLDIFYVMKIRKILNSYKGLLSKHNGLTLERK